jgi:hypothetical protein
MVDPTAFGYGDIRFRWGDHICAVFENHHQQMAVMVPFVTHGLRAGQRCVWISPPASSHTFRQALARTGADLRTLEASSQLIILPDVEFYLHDGVFEPDRTMELGLTLLQDGQRSGYSTMRVTSDLSWLTGRSVDEERWESYEHLVTQRIEQVPVVAVCQYDHRQLSGKLVLAALHTHPIVILGETVCANPFFSPPATDGPGRHDVM